MAKENEAFVAYNASAWGALTIAPSDTTVLTPNLRALWVGGAGNVAVRMLDGNTVIFVGVPAGTYLPIQIDQVRLTSTTATNMIGMY